MGVKKVSFYGTEIVNHAGATVDASTLSKGVKAWDAKGDLITGELEAEAGGEYDAVSVSNGDGTQTLRITTAGSGSGGGDSGGGGGDSDMMVFTKTYTQAAVVSTATDVQLISRGELQAAGLVGATGTMCDVWEQVMIDMMAISTPTHLAWQVIHAYATTKKGIIYPSGDGNGFETVTYHTSSTTYNITDQMYRPITMATEGYLFEDGNVNFRADSTHNLCPGEFELTVYARGRKA